MLALALAHMAGLIDARICACLHPDSDHRLTNRIYTFNITTYPSLNKQGQGPETSPAMSRGHSLLFELTLRSSQSVSEFMQTELWIASCGPNIGTPSVATL